MNAERLLQHYEQIADAPDAIVRLRRFILDLAVRGKLVPQDPTDEPASELLKRIAKAKSLSGRKERAKKRSEDLTKDGKGVPLPAGWTFAPLADLVAVINGRAYKQQELLSAGVPVLRVGNLFTSDKWYYSDLQLPEDKYCERGDLIFAWSASFGPFIWDGEKVIYHYHIWKLVLQSEADVNKLYLYSFLLQKTREIKEAGHGISMIHMTKEKMERLSVPLPPLAEQHRIVTKVDELMALCDELEAARTEREAKRDRLAAASFARLNAPDPQTFRDDARFALDALPALTTRPNQIKQLRQTILNLAVRGKLVPQDPTDESAAELLRQIAGKRAEKGRKAGGRRNGLPDASLRREEQLEPQNWVWTQLGEVALSMRYGTSVKCDYGTKGAPVLRIPNVSGGRVSLDDMKFGPLSPSEIEDLGLLKGDILLIRSNGSLEIVGRAAVVTSEAVGMSFAGYLVRLRTDLKNINPEYIWLALQSSEVRNQIEQPIRSAVGLKNVNLTEFGALTFCLPPLAEQHRIVAKVDELMVLCDQLEASLSCADETRKKLLDALLAEALVPEETVALQEAAE